MLESAKSKHPMLTNREIIFEVFPCNVRDHDTSALLADRRTDRRIGVAIPRSAALRGKNDT